MLGLFSQKPRLSKEEMKIFLDQNKIRRKKNRRSKLLSHQNPARIWPDMRPRLNHFFFQNCKAIRPAIRPVSGRISGRIWPFPFSKIFSFLIRVEKLFYSTRPTKISTKGKPPSCGASQSPLLKRMSSSTFPLVRTRFK